MTPAPPDDPRSELGRTFTRQAVRSLAGPRSFERGEECAASGRAAKLRLTGTTVQATVRGSSTYHVRLWAEDGEAALSCTCPVGARGRFCKHAVALALAAADARAAHGEVDAAAGVDVHSHLAGLEHGRLVDLVLELASTNELAEGRLRLAAARADSGPPPIQALADAIGEAFATDGFVSCRGADAYAERIHDMIDALQGLLDDGQAPAVMRLAEHALKRAQDALGDVDDSAGQLGRSRRSSKGSTSRPASRPAPTRPSSPRGVRP